jgi:hypothetical protein
MSQFSTFLALLKTPFLKLKSIFVPVDKIQPEG